MIDSFSPTIGVLDSGLGGLLTFAALQQRLPWAKLVYHGDTQYAPYGEKSAEFLRARVPAILRFLHQEYQVQFIVLACNTSASVLGPELQALCDSLNMKFWDILLGAKKTVQNLAEKQSPWQTQLGVLATAATVQTGRYTVLAAQHGLHVTQVACPELVPLIEHNQLRSRAVKTTVRKYLDELLTKNPAMSDVILGCTHYPFLLPVFAELAPQLHFWDPATALVDQVCTELPFTSQNTTSKNSNVLLTSGDPVLFSKQATELLHLPQTQAIHTEIIFKQ